MTKITYLLGAGASVGANKDNLCLPIVSEIPKRIEALIQFLSQEHLLLDPNSFFSLKFGNSSKPKQHYQRELINDFRWLMEAANDHASVDTYAKKLYIKNKTKELKRLKNTLSFFFILEQANHKPDKRYDAFIASIINKKKEFPDFIRIVSWNYDYQFEIAMSDYLENNSLYELFVELNIKSKYIKTRSNTGLGLFKINGTCCFYDRDFNGIFNISINQKADKAFIERVVEQYCIATTSQYYENMLSFSWENEEVEDQNESILSKTIESVNDSEILIVIGYSFPFFNREIDRQIIGSMYKLDKVYIQSPESEVIKERLMAIRESEIPQGIYTRQDVGQFLLPYEL